MNVEDELKSLRYLVNDLILYIYDLRTKLEEISPSKRKYVMKGEPNGNGESVGFDLFSINKAKYEALVSQYGIDIVNRACVKLDQFIKIHRYIPYHHPSISLAKRFIPTVLRDIDIEKNELKKIEEMKNGKKISES